MENRRYPDAQQKASPMSNSDASFGIGYSDDVVAVLRNTYMLLGMTLAFSAFVAWMSMDAAYPGPIITIAVYLGLLFVTYKLQNSAWGILSTFALTGFMGYTLGPMIGAFAAAEAMGIVNLALSMTAVTFVGLSVFTLVTRKDFSFLSGFIMIGFLVLLAGIVANIFLQIPALQLAISAGVTLFAGACILFQTSAIIHGGERNYIMATIGLYVAIYNLFVSLLHLLMAFSGDE
ncbi:MAG: BAX inhibitor protein [Alteromonadaceae bacterium]|uniref:BAX inhibitor (BI)-1/YccA family protein n=2 Tax=Hydrocarboniclastica marina TaxID=2259620 RepID=A0A4P7XGN0_9ALTE|nr:BAX inhibitor protein [Alteromonadaceae bacterium]QCF26168.1 BAX inhibitor (BI)-1/YccA family protein [Hydrocarboniclastica marina]